jgi:ketosteroid isomerase-like protein
MSRENVEVVRRAVDAYNRGDFDAIRALNDPEVELDWSASRGLAPEVYRGQESVMGFYENYLGVFEQVTLEPDRFIEAEDAVVVPNCARFRGREGIGTAARSTLVFNVRGGRITRIRLYQDTREALEAVGLPD